MRRLGDYELLRKIGAGGMAEVWMGRRAAMAGASKAVAIKLLARDMLDDPDYRAMFIEEARLSMLLTNSNVVQVFDVGEIDGEVFMVMEWVDGLNLAELTHKMSGAQERLPVEVAAHVIGEVLRALAYAHGLHHDGVQATIVHRDVSPHNVLVSISGEIKLADFGVARLAREETSGLHVKGKLRYMAPEQLRGRSREPTVDLYAVGAILHELLEGQRFRTTRDEGDLYSLVLSGAYPPLTVPVPAELDHLRKRLLEPDPDKRLQSADEALELLYAWPGYRNSSLELGRLTRKWVGVKAPRSGILSGAHVAAAQAAGAAAAGPSGPLSAAMTNPAASAANPAASAANPAASPAAPSPRAVSTPTADDHSDAVTMVESQAESGPQPDRGVTTTRTAVERSPEVAPTSMIPVEAAAPARPAQTSSMVIVALLTLAVSFGVFGLGFPLGWWGGGDKVATESTTVDPAAPAEPPREQPDEVVAADSTRAIEPATAATPDPTTDSADTTTTGPQVAVADTPVPDLPPEDTTTTTTGPIVELVPDEEDPAPVKALKADVEIIVAITNNWAYLRVGNKSVTAEPMASLKLDEGTHTVKYRQDPEAPWKTAGKIKVVGGKAHKFKLNADGSLKAL